MPYTFSFPESDYITGTFTAAAFANVIKAVVAIGGLEPPTSRLI